MGDSNGSKLDTRSRFVQIYDRLKSELLEDPAFDFTDDARQWIERHGFLKKLSEMDVPGGKKLLEWLEKGNLRSLFSRK